MGHRIRRIHHPRIIVRIPVATLVEILVVSRVPEGITRPLRQASTATALLDSSKAVQDIFRPFSHRRKINDTIPATRGTTVPQDSRMPTNMASLSILHSTTAIAARRRLKGTVHTLDTAWTIVGRLLSNSSKRHRGNARPLRAGTAGSER
jgi:hypothetical protein